MGGRLSAALRRDPRRFRDIAAHAEGVFYLSRRHHAADVTENGKLRLSVRGAIAVIKDFCIGRPLRHETLIGGRLVFEGVSRYCFLNADFSFFRRAIRSDCPDWNDSCGRGDNGRQYEQ
jgi:hypothetical protein